MTTAGLVYCMDYLEKNIDWLQDKLRPLVKGSVSKCFLLDFGSVHRLSSVVSARLQLIRRLVSRCGSLW